ncbi:hypothetical protein QL285_026544 [Trifolium repens]|nr:hypothetical protein QL285_026544 [Trifolium repens]
MGMALSTALRRTIRPPRLIYLLPQAPNLFLRDTRRGSQVEARRGFTPIGRPKYLKGMELTQQFKNTEAKVKKSCDTLTPIRLLFQKLTLSPETISNPLSIALRVQRFAIVASPMQSVSSAYWRCEIVTSPSPIWNPLK